MQMWLSLWAEAAVFNQKSRPAGCGCVCTETPQWPRSGTDGIPRSELTPRPAGLPGCKNRGATQLAPRCTAAASPPRSLSGAPQAPRPTGLTQVLAQSPRPAGALRPGRAPRRPPCHRPRPVRGPHLGKYWAASDSLGVRG